MTQVREIFQSHAHASKVAHVDLFLGTGPSHQGM